MPKKLLRKKAVLLLRQYGELDTVQLRDYINTCLKHGTTVSELGNMLGKDRKLFEKVRAEKRMSSQGRSSGNYKVYVWRLKDNN